MAEIEVWRSHLTPLRFLERNAVVFRERPAVVYGATQYSYGQLSERVHRLASALRSYGIQKGDRVAFLAPNIPPMLEAHFGVPLAGAVLVAINIRLAPEELRYILDHSGAKLLFVDTELSDLVEPVLGRIVPSLRSGQAPMPTVGVGDDPNAVRGKFAHGKCTRALAISRTCLAYV